MLEDRNAIATIAVKDLDVSSKFYEGTLGLKPDGNQEPGARSYKSGDTGVLVYESRYAGTNQATAATWFVDDVDRLVKDLKAKGVAFEHYDMPEMARKGDVHVAGSMRAAWFKDPDGNILALISQ
jgi:catechol 2,3-dioxygenase-like lactoylglutathione lyase family enzyme